MSSEEDSKVNVILQSSKIVSAGFSFIPKTSEVFVKFQFTRGHNDFSLHKLHTNFKRKNNLSPPLDCAGSNNTASWMLGV